MLERAIKLGIVLGLASACVSPMDELSADKVSGAEPNVKRLRVSFWSTTEHSFDEASESWESTLVESMTALGYELEHPSFPGPNGFELSVELESCEGIEVSGGSQLSYRFSYFDERFVGATEVASWRSELCHLSDSSLTEVLEELPSRLAGIPTYDLAVTLENIVLFDEIEEQEQMIAELELAHNMNGKPDGAELMVGNSRTINPDEYLQGLYSLSSALTSVDSEHHVRVWSYDLFRVVISDQFGRAVDADDSSITNYYVPFDASPQDMLEGLSHL